MPAPDDGRNLTVRLANLVDGNVSVGTVGVHTRPDWAPRGVERFHELVDSGFFNANRFFRVVDGFVVQWGINGDPAVTKAWKRSEIPDDVPNVKSNTRGTIAFASAGPDTRTTQLFINLVDNPRLDDDFMPVAEITSGFEQVLRINDEYHELPDQFKIETEGNAYLEREFPNLSFIVTMK